MKKVLFAAAECDPFVKTGGLGTVVGSLPEALNANGYEVRVVLPLYACIPQTFKDQMTKRLEFPVELGWRLQSAALYEMTLNGILYYFIGNSLYFSTGNPYEDLWRDVEKFSFFDKAVLEMLSYIDYEPAVIHCHDWHTGLIPVYLKAVYGEDPFYQKIRTVMTIHNLKFQGKLPADVFQDATGLPDWVFRWDGLGDEGCGNMMKGGLAWADRITTVSRTYAAEIMTPDYGEGLSGLLAYRGEDILGIVNGIDTTIYNPAEDPAIAFPYDVSNLREGKRKNKLALQKKTGMPEDEGIFTIAIISRLSDQKGFALLGPHMEELMEQKMQLYVLGGGDPVLEQMFAEARDRYPDRIYTCFDYTDPLAKLMYAGCDAVLMPSRFEPCGLCQLMAYRYGTVPVVRLTGGLADTVKPYHEKKSVSTGFGFKEYSPDALYGVLEDTISLYYEKPRAFQAMSTRCMGQDYSWKEQAKEYGTLYESITA